MTISDYLRLKIQISSNKKMQKKNTTLQILIPTYNRADLLSECLESIISQMHEYSEFVSILVADNNSVDHTSEIVRLHSESSKISVKYIKQPVNIGFSENLGKGITECSATWVWLLGDDDFLLPGALRTVIALLSEETTDASNVISVLYAECEQNLSSISTRNITTYKSGIVTSSQFLSNGLPYLTFLSQFILRRSDYIAYYKPDENKFRFVPHLKVIGKMLSQTQPYFINQYCVMGRRNHTGLSQWNGIWPVVFGFEHPDIIADISSYSSLPRKTLGFVNIRAWFVMAIFREEYALPFIHSSRPSSWKFRYKLIVIFENLLESETLRSLVKRIITKLYRDRISDSLNNAKKLFEVNSEIRN